MLIKREDCCLLVIDVQERLLPTMYDPAPVTANCRALLEAARDAEVPVLVSEHYPKGIGSTARALADLVSPGAVMEKIFFSCFAESSARQRIRATGRPDVVMAGMEAHVCLGQTAIDLAAAGFRVFVASDATASRSRLDHETALYRMAQEGVEIVTTGHVVAAWAAGGARQQRRLAGELR